MRPWQRPPMTAKPSPTACSRTWIGPLSRPTGEPRAGSGSFTRQLKARSLLIPTASVTVAGYRCLPSTPKERFPHAHVRILQFQDEHRAPGAGSPSTTPATSASKARSPP